VVNPNYPYLSDGTVGSTNLNDGAIPWNVAEYHQGNLPMFMQVEVTENSLTLRAVQVNVVVHNDGTTTITTTVEDTLIICACNGEESDDCVCVCQICDDAGCIACCVVCDTLQGCVCVVCEWCERLNCNSIHCLGDVTGNGKVEVQDALQILRFLVELSNVISFEGEENDDARLASIIYIFPEHLQSLNNRYYPVVDDALQILRYLVKLPSNLEFWRAREQQVLDG
jgi:hypothetical protein